MMKKKLINEIFFFVEIIEILSFIYKMKYKTNIYVNITI